MNSFLAPESSVVVTGATGFVGQTVVETLSKASYRVIGVSERREPPRRIAAILSDYVCADLTRSWPRLPPFRGVVHLAGLAAVGPSFDCPQEYINRNSSMLTWMFEDALKDSWTGRAIVVSSGAVYGSSGSAFTESNPTVASSPYVVSKMLVETQVSYYRRRGVDALVARPFNHIGPGQAKGFIVPDLTEKIRSWRPENRVKFGNLDSLRDYTDVRDIARAYKLLLELDRPRHGLYNICSGSAHSGWDVLSAVCQALERPVPDARSSSDRAVDPQVVTGDNARISAETGWRPTILLNDSVADYVADLLDAR